MTRTSSVLSAATAMLRGAHALVVAIAVTSPALAGEDTPALALHVADPAAVSFDSTALGRATHALRLTVTNQGARAMALEPLALRFRAVREGLVFVCEAPRSREDRWPATLDAGETFAFSREVTCDTPLPGRYDVEVYGRPRSADWSPERAYDSFALQIDPGANPPVRLPWAPSLFGAASGTRDMRPTKDPGGARIVVAMINSTPVAVTLARVHATMRIRRRGSSVQACPDRGADLGFVGSLAPGGVQRLSTPLGCDISAEALYDVEVWVANASGASVRLATHTIRVTVNAPTSPGPQDDPKGKPGGT